LPPENARQEVFEGRTLEIQLPAVPAVWEFLLSKSSNVKMIGPPDSFVPSLGRIQGFDSVQVLTFAANGIGPTRIVLQGNALPPGFEPIVPGGRYQLELEVVPAPD
jgi:hypothetical protein